MVQRQPLPADGVSNPRLLGVRWFPANGGHTLRGAFLTFWQSQPDAAGLIGYPLTEEFTDPTHGGVRAQYFERMELLQQGGMVVPAPLGAQLVPATYVMTTTSTMSTTSYAVDPHFQSFWSQNGGASFFGPPVSPAFRQANGDGTRRLYLVQYFRNARLEYHPEVASTGNTIEVGKSEGKFTHIRFKVEDGDLLMEKIVVTFGNGDKFEPDYTRLNHDAKRVFGLDPKKFAVYGPDVAAKKLADALTKRGMTVQV